MISVIHLQHDPDTHAFYLTSGRPDGRTHTSKVSDGVALVLIKAHYDALDGLESHADEFTADDRTDAAA